MTTNRRQFLKAAGAAPLFVPRSAWGANDRLTYGVIGTGGMGRFDSKCFMAAQCECVAICDVYEPNLQLAQKDAPQSKPYLDYNDLLAHPGLDMVLIATPEHQHCPNLLAALKAGKDVYLEKPLSHSLEESKRMIAAVRQTNRIVQIGMQRRSSSMIRRAKALVDDGALGRISMVKAEWNWNTPFTLDNSPLPGKLDWKRFLGAAPDRPLDPLRFRVWRLFWDYSGGNMTDQGTHLMDVAQWFTNTTETRAVSAICHGQLIKYAGTETPDAFCAVFEYPKHMATWTLNYCNEYPPSWSVTFQGDLATLVLDGDGARVYAEPKKGERRTLEPFFIDRSPVLHQQHVDNFVACVRSRTEPNCPVEVGACAVSAPHLANLAMHQRRQVKMSEA